MAAHRRTLVWLTVFAVAMADIEAALVVHLRHLYYPDDPRLLFPLAVMTSSDFAIEVVRELITLLMILAVAALAARTPGRMLGVFLYIFGVWDLSYYAWLKVMIGWPVTWVEWDVLFLVPWPWLGPWMTAALVALLFGLWGGWIVATGAEVRLRWGPVLALVAGASMVVGGFLVPAAPLLSQGTAAFKGWQPGGFPWALYLVGCALMIAGLLWLANKRDPQ